MATRKKDTLEDLLQEITCPLCLDTFNDPRVLLCQHTYCKECLEAFISRGRGVSSTVICPECRKFTDVPRDGVRDLPIAFKLNRLIDLVEKMRVEDREKSSTGTVETDGSFSPLPVGKSNNCRKHPGQTLDVYCRKCDEAVCSDCILFGEHANHPYGKLLVTANEDRKTITLKLNALLRKRALIEKCVTDVKVARYNTEESCEIVCGSISDSYDRVLSVVEQKKNQHIKDYRDDVNTRVKELNSSESSLSMTLSEMDAVKSMVERGLKNMGDADITTRKKGMLLKIEQMNTRINKLSQDKPVGDLEVDVLDQKAVVEVEDLCSRLLRTYRTVDSTKCVARVGGDGGSVAKVGEMATIVIVLKDSEGEMCRLQQCVTVELTCGRFGERVNGKVMERSSSSYEANITPTIRTRGQCQVVVKVNDAIIGGKPIAMFIECDPHKLGEPVHIINDVQQPGCLKVSNMRIFCRTSTGVCILDLENINKPMVQSGMFPRDGKTANWWPSEMAVHGSYLFVSDPRNGKVHKFKLDGQYVKSTPTTKDTLQTPNGLSMSPSGALYVCDSDCHCIHIFNSDLSLCSVFGSQGSAPGLFSWPDNIAFDCFGNYYITDYSNNRIQCFTSSRHLKWYTATDGNLKEPNVMQVVGNKLFVTDLGGVAVFNTNGQFITRFASICAASESKSSADGIAVDADGFVFVSDTPRNRIVVF